MPDYDIAKPHEYDHSHSSSAGSGWLRASVFGAMDGLVSNIGLISGIAAAGASSAIVAITGISGLISGAISMALGEYTSVRTQNEQLAVEVQTERAALDRNPEGEEAELSVMFTHLGMDERTARTAASQVHANTEQALRVHLAHELGLSPDERPSPMVAAGASLLAFSAGAVIPVLPFLLGFGTLFWGLLFGGVGLLLAGFIAARFTDRNPFAGAGRQLLFGGIAVAVTYGIGRLLGVSGLG
ncbi:VIT1/CCC1 transporter family protein [Leucobacter weissii]|uniref:VIT1/CCC1 transporter family protein n=1 Tax=Leucobacter weissii TaxID=1983706 RepID=A0A939MK68_9MICO|nr:VIT1/CCC1 transporter family protein [Leucobacter weissii]